MFEAITVMFEVNQFGSFWLFWFEQNMSDCMFEQAVMFGPCGRDGEAIAGASIEKEAMNGTAKAPAAATPLSSVRLLGATRSRLSLEFSMLTNTSSPL